jgi:hypothetical protein
MAMGLTIQNTSIVMSYHLDCPNRKKQSWWSKIATIFAPSWAGRRSKSKKCYVFPLMTATLVFIKSKLEQFFG